MIKIKKTRSSGKIVQSFESRDNLSKSKPTKSLIKKNRRSTGRDQKGHVSVRHKGGGVKRKYREISNLESLEGEKFEVLAIEYDPNRTARIALIELPNGRKKYIIATENLIKGNQVRFSVTEELSSGDRSRLKDIPVGSEICNIQLFPDKNTYIARAAGTKATLMALEGNYALLKLPSGELRRVHKNCYASFGQISNSEHSNIVIGKAGRKRKMGIRPTVRGKAMHPAAHPHGGGEGVNPIGLKHPKTPWGKIAMGKKTRRNKGTDKFIVKSRPRKRGK